MQRVSAVEAVALRLHDESARPSRDVRNVQTAIDARIVPDRRTPRNASVTCTGALLRRRESTTVPSDEQRRPPAAHNN